TFYEFNGSTLTPVPATPQSPGNAAYGTRMVLLPTGQVLYTDGSTDVEIYTPGGSANAAWAPTITSVRTILRPGLTYPIIGTQFNGLSQGASYGDDAQAATNYPLVRITNRATGHVFYARTHDHSTMAVASPDLASTHYDVPADMERGLGDLVVVANGIASAAIAVNVQ